MVDDDGDARDRASDADSGRRKPERKKRSNEELYAENIEEYKAADNSGDYAKAEGELGKALRHAGTSGTPENQRGDVHIMYLDHWWKRSMVAVDNAEWRRCTQKWEERIGLAKFEFKKSGAADKLLKMERDEQMKLCRINIEVGREASQAYWRGSKKLENATLDHRRWLDPACQAAAKAAIPAFAACADHLYEKKCAPPVPIMPDPQRPLFFGLTQEPVVQVRERAPWPVLLDTACS